MKTKNFVFVGILFCLNTAIAQHEQSSAENFEVCKQEVLKHIDEMSKAINDHKQCVANSSNMAAMQECRHKNREAMKSHKIDIMEKRRDRLNQHLEKEKSKK